VSPTPVRAVDVLAVGGTIAMRGEHAAPALDAAALVAAVPKLATVEGLRAHTLANVPGAHLTPSGALDVARAARDITRAGRGVVVTHGTDTLEETAFLCDLLADAEAPVIVTGAMRPASAPGADGPANLLDAVAAAGAAGTAGAGALVCFGGELHAARFARKVDSTGPAAFASPRSGPVGRVAEGRVTLWAQPLRAAPLDPAALEARVEIIVSSLGADGALLRAAAATADGVVVELLGAGHAPPGLFAALTDIAAELPVVTVVRPGRGAILHETYGYCGSEIELRGTAAIPAGLLSAVAARMKLLACLGAGLAGVDLRTAFGIDD
jgi:L-asparaginase